jgi:hypothetical protein
MSTRTRILLMCGSAALALAIAPASHDPVQAANRQEVRLSGPRVSTLGGGAYVVTLEAAGDIRGLLTLDLKSNGATVTAGEWVLVSRYLQDTITGSEELGPTGEHDGIVHEERIAFRERGTLRGSISGGGLSFDSEGRLAGIDGLKLAVVGGDIEFAGAAGTASVSASNLQDERNGSGQAVLAGEVK